MAGVWLVGADRGTWVNAKSREAAGSTLHRHEMSVQMGMLGIVPDDLTTDADTYIVKGDAAATVIGNTHAHDRGVRRTLDSGDIAVGSV